MLLYRPELYALPRDLVSVLSPYQRHSKKYLREVRANPFTAAPVSSNDAVAELFASKLKRIPRYQYKMQSFSLISAATGSFSGGRSKSWFSSEKVNHAASSGRTFARRGSGNVDSNFSETASEANASACIHNAFLTLLCYVISKNKHLPAVRRAPPSTTKVIDEYGKGLSDAVRGSTLSHSGDEDSLSGQSLRRTISASISASSIIKGMVKLSASSSGEERGHDIPPTSEINDLRVTVPSVGSASSLDISGFRSPKREGSAENVSLTLPDAVIVHSEYDSGNENDLESVTAEFKHISANIREETFLAWKAGLKLAFEVLYVMTEKNLPPDELTYRSLAECCAICGDGHCAVDLLEDMLHWGYLPDPDITSSVVQAMLHSSATEFRTSSVNDVGTTADRFVTGKDVMDAVNSNQLYLLRQRLENRFDDDIHTYASRGTTNFDHEAADFHAKHQESSPQVVFATPSSSRPDLLVQKVTSTDSLCSFDDTCDNLANKSVDPAKASGEISRKTSNMSSSGAGKSVPLFLKKPVEAASNRLTTQSTMADRILDMQFPDLEINLLHPNGTHCPNFRCGKALTLEQLREGWDCVDPNKYTTKCSYCSREFVPRFTVYSSCTTWMIEEMDLLTGVLGEDVNEAESLLWCEYLSPWVLRKELLTVLMNDGIDTVLSTEFRSPSPSNSQNLVIFWNMIIAFRSCGLPYSFLVSETLSTAFLVPLID